MLAILSLVALGMKLGEARRVVEEAGAWPENARQTGSSSGWRGCWLRTEI